MRGRRSQTQLMRRLGYASNAPYLWESGRRFPPTSVLVRLLTLKGSTLGGMTGFAGMPEPLPRSWGARETGVWLRELLGETPATEIARAVQSDRGTVARWLRGQTEPRVPELLRLVDTLTHRLVELVALFVEPERLPSLRGLARQLRAQARIAYELPWSHALLRSLELREYRDAGRHVPERLARAIGLEAEEVETLLTELRAAGLIRRWKGQWRPVSVLTVDTRARVEGDRLLKLHWAKVATQRLEAGPIRVDSYFSYNLCAVSHADYTRIRELHQEYYERVRRVVAESKTADRVLLINQQLVPLDVRG